MIKWKATQKETQEFPESFNTLTVFCYLTEVKEKYILKYASMSHNFFNFMVIFTV